MSPLQGTHMAKSKALTATISDRIAVLEQVCAEAYQFAGTVGAPERVLDNLSAAVEGRPLPYLSFLPVAAEECDEVRRLLRDRAAVALGRAGGRSKSAVKARASAVNGRRGGRPRKPRV